MERSESKWDDKRLAYLCDDCPVNALCAGRGGERAVVAVVGTLDFLERQLNSDGCPGCHWLSNWWQLGEELHSNQRGMKPWVGKSRHSLFYLLVEHCTYRGS